MKRLILFLAIMTPLASFAEEIDFNEVLKDRNHISDGPVSIESKDFQNRVDTKMNRFDEQNRQKREKIMNDIGTALNRDTNTAPQSANMAALSGKKYSCSLDCETGASKLTQHKGGEITIDVFASDKSEAQRIAMDKGYERCRSIGYGGVYKRLVDSSAYCVEK